MSKRKMSIQEAEEIIYACSCCRIGKCEICPLAGDPYSNVCSRERLRSWIQEKVAVCGAGKEAEDDG